MKKIFYSLSQGIGNIFRSKFIVALILSCYTVGFLFPLMVWAYRDGMIDAYTEKPQLEFKGSDMVNSINFYRIPEERLREKPSEALSEDYFASVLPEGVKANVRLTLQDSAFYGDYPIAGTISYIQYGDSSVFVADDYKEEYLAGQGIQNDSEAVIGSGALPKGTVFKNVIGRTVQYGKNEYTICGVIRESARVFLSINTLSSFPRHFSTQISVSVPNMSTEDFSPIAEKIGEAFDKQKFIPPSANTEIKIDAAKQIADELFPFAALGLFFCAANVITLVAALISMKKRDLLIQQSMGATPFDIFIQQLVFISVITIIATAASYLLAYLISILSVELDIITLLIQPAHILGLLVMSLVISVVTSAFFAIFSSRLNLSGVGRSV